MEFIHEMFDRVLTFSILAIVIVALVWKKYAEAHPAEAKQFQGWAEKGISDWLEKKPKPPKKPTDDEKL